MNLEPIVQRMWSQRGWASTMLLPLATLYGYVVGRRQRQLVRARSAETAWPIPVWIIGNLTVGGTGKTPLVLALIQLAAARGLRVGIVSRGYGGRLPDPPRSVEDQPDPAVVGDEPYLIWKRAGVPVMVDPDRAHAVECLLERYPIDLVLSDDGLQHYRLHRDFEVVVLDAVRGLGNGRLIPAGPLREPSERLHSVDLVVRNGPWRTDAEIAFVLRPGEFVNLGSGERCRPEAFLDRPLLAVAGIGNPQRFHATLSELGLTFEVRNFPDHHAFTAGDLQRPAGIAVVMTEKDAVKCSGLADADCWYLEVAAVFSPALADRVGSALAQIPQRP